MVTAGILGFLVAGIFTWLATRPTTPSPGSNDPATLAGGRSRMVSKWLLMFCLAASIAALLILVLPLLLAALPTSSDAEWAKWQEQHKWAAAWMTLAGAAGAAMLIAALVAIILAVAGYIGWRRALLAVLVLTAVALGIVYADFLASAGSRSYALYTKWHAGLTTWDLWAIAIVLVGILIVAHYFLDRNHDDWLVRTVRAAAVVLLAILFLPALVRFASPHLACIGSDEECKRIETTLSIKEASRQAAIEYQRRLAVKKAERDASRKVSGGCPGDENVVELTSSSTSHINRNKCAFVGEPISGKVVFVDWTGLQTSKPVGPGECVELNFVVAGAYAAPGSRARLKYSLCAGDGRVPLDYECVPRQQRSFC